MNKRIITYFLLIILLVSISCNSSKYFSYSLSNYVIKNNRVDRLPFKNDLISYNGYLFEFKFDWLQKDTFYQGTNSIKKSQRVDTSGVYILNPLNRTFTLYDSFSMNSKILKSGKFSEKEFGNRLTDEEIKQSNYFINKKLKDTFLWGQMIYYLDTIEKNYKQVDSIRSHIYFLKEKKFTSLYELTMTTFPEKDFSMVGYTSYFCLTGETWQGTLENFRVLSKKEIQICKSLISKMLKTQ